MDSLPEEGIARILDGARGSKLLCDIEGKGFWNLAAQSFGAR